jgi:transcriptional regulator with XRE-family HTH domain
LKIAGEDVATALNWSQSKVSRVENAKIGISMRDLAALLHYYGVPEDVRAELISMNAEESGQDGAWIVRAGGTTRRQGEVAAIETRVTAIKQFHSSLIPGQLQSPSYARWFVTAAGYSDVDGIVQRRMARQQLFLSSDAPAYSAVLDARALLYWPDRDAAVVEEQFEHLKLRMELPAIQLRIIPLGAMHRAAALVPFIIYTFRTKSPAVVLAESQTADLYLSSPIDVRVYEDLFQRLSGDSLSHDDSRTYLDVLARDIRKITSDHRL